MKNLILKIILISFLLALGNLLKAQNDFTLYQMRAVPQVVNVNPSAIPLSKFNLGLPGISAIYNNFSNSGFKYNDFFNLHGTDELKLNFPGALDAMADVNAINNYFRTDLFSLGFKAGNNYFSLGITEKVDFRFSYPKDLFVFLYEGNGGSLLGKRASFDGLGVDLLHYRQYALGYARRLGPALTIGGRFNYLYGQEAVYTRTSRIGLTTNALTYAMTLDGELEINTAGVDPENFDNLDPVKYLLGGKNTGYSLDFGASYNFFNLLTLSASVIDLGSIKWRENTKSYNLDRQEFTFEGIDLFKVINPLETTGNTQANTGVFDDIVDTIITKFTNVQESATEFTTPLNTQIYLAANYNLTNRLNFGVLTRNQFVKGKLSTAASLSLNTTIGNFLSASVNYSIGGRSNANIGTGISANLGPMQVYLITDNALAFVQWYAVKNVHLRFGVNYTFGRDYEF